MLWSRLLPGMFSTQHLDGRYNNNYCDKVLSLSAAFALANRSKVPRTKLWSKAQAPGEGRSLRELNLRKLAQPYLSLGNTVHLLILGACPPGKANRNTRPDPVFLYPLCSAVTNPKELPGDCGLSCHKEENGCLPGKEQQSH